MAGTSAVWPGYKAIAAAIAGDATLAAMLVGVAGDGGIYNLMAPREAEPTYVVLGTPSENDFPLFAGAGSSLVVMVHVWAPGPDGATCAQVYGELHRVLHRATLNLEGFGPAAAYLSLVDIAGDAQDLTAHGVARLELTAIA